LTINGNKHNISVNKDIIIQEKLSSLSKKITEFISEVVLMKYSNKLLLGFLSLGMTIFLLVGCTAESEEEQSQPEQESQAEIELQILQEKYDELSSDYNDIKSELEIIQAAYDNLSTKNNELNTKYDDLNAKYNELSTKYDNLKASYDALTQEPEVIKEEDLEQAIFALINLERQELGLPLIEWSDGLYWYATKHSDDMAEKKRLEYSGYSYWQDIFRAAGYKTVDEIADAAMIVWKDSLQYAVNFLSKGAQFGAVGVTKSGEIFYITFFAHIY